MTTFSPHELDVWWSPSLVGDEHAFLDVGGQGDVEPVGPMGEPADDGSQSVSEIFMLENQFLITLLCR